MLDRQLPCEGINEEGEKINKENKKNANVDPREKVPSFRQVNFGNNEG